MNAPTQFAPQPLSTGAAPTWASEWGEDGYGVFAGFTVGGVTQRMRWIRPGSFLMGSPEDEPERFDDEGPQHRVTISPGFWLADTACTQALWQAVMGENPRRFQGDRRPVERVSWDHIQIFFKQINASAPGLDLTPPTEARWEYACRAGTTTPFSFGARIDPMLVNYDADFPYNGGAKGLDRGETLEVATLPPNLWGLHEMHGNVWEWCADVYHPTYKGAPNDGTAWLDGAGRKDVARRVLRGGSWGLTAGSCRSAARFGSDPGGRNDDFGFRCARVQEQESGAP